MSRTHQLNTTGRMLAEEELAAILRDRSGRFCVEVADMTDRFGGMDHRRRCRRER